MFDILAWGSGEVTEVRCSPTGMDDWDGNILQLGAVRL